jgi:hypothetical protein
MSVNEHKTVTKIKRKSGTVTEAENDSSKPTETEADNKFKKERKYPSFGVTAVQNAKIRLQ